MTRDVQTLEALAQLATQAGAPEIARDAEALALRTAAGRFYVACVGQFKRGKSTLINALVGSPLLPTGVAPVTAVPTVIAYGPAAARVRRAGQGWIEIDPATIADWVTEQGNPGNRKEVLAVEAFAPSPLLAGGMCLVDTPGLGSVFEANSQATREFVPHIDAAVAVLGADPPISGEELQLLADVARQVDHVVFVLNKADRLPPEERREAVAFTERVLSQRLGRPVGPLFEVSALAAARGEPGAGTWPQLVETLGELAARSGSALVAAALARGLDRLGFRLRRVLLEQRSALLRPIEESEHRADELATLAAQAERALAELGPLLSVDQHRLSRLFAVRQEEFLARAIPQSAAELQERLRTAGAGGTRRKAALDLANDIAREQLTPWLADAERAAERAYREAVARFIELANGFLARLASSSGWLAGDLDLSGDDDGEDFSAKRGFYFTDLLYRHVPASPWVWIGDAMLPPGLRRKRVAGAAERYLIDLLTVNATRVRSDLDDRLSQSRRRLEVRIRTVLHEVHQAAIRALERARVAHAAGQQAVEHELGSIDAALAELTALVGEGAAAGV